MTGRILKSALLSILLAAGAGLSSCEHDSATGPANDELLAMTYNKIHIVSERDRISLVETLDSSLVFDMQGGIPDIRPGFMILGMDNGGYLRKVLSTAVDGRRLFVRTGQAYIADAIIRGRIDTTLTLGFGSPAFAGTGQQGASDVEPPQAIRGVSVSENGLDLSGVILYAGKAGDAEVSVTIARGRIEFAPELDLFAELGLSRLTGFHAIADGMLNLDYDVEIVATGPFDLAREMTLASMSTTIIQHIRSLPVVGVIRLSFIVSFDISSKFAGACRTGIEAATRIRFGPHYDHDGWSSVASATPEFTPHTIYYESREDAEIMVSIKPRIDVEFFGLPCSSSAFGPYAGLIERESGFPVLEWELFAGIGGATEFHHGALTREPLAHEASPRCCRTTLDAGPFRTDAYVFVTQWGSEGSLAGAFGYPKGIAADRDGNVYVVDNWNDNVQKFSPDGAFLLKWGTSGSGDGQFASPEKIAIDDEGNVYVVDGANCRVQKFSPDGAFLAKWGSRGSGEGQFLSPVGIAISQGHVLVTDNASSRVQKFSANGDFIAAWGSYGSGDGQFDGAAGIAAKAGDSMVFATDCHNNRIQRFSLDGFFLASWGSGGSGDGQFDCPVDLAVGPDGTVFVADIGNDRIVLFTQAGAFVTKLGSTGTGEGQFNHPEGVAVDGQGNLYVVDARNKRIEKFAPRSHATVITAGAPSYPPRVW